VRQSDLASSIRSVCVADQKGVKSERRQFSKDAHNR